MQMLALGKTLSQLVPSVDAGTTAPRKVPTKSVEDESLERTGILFHLDKSFSSTKKGSPSMTLLSDDQSNGVV
jgi:hypothetical protein